MMAEESNGLQESAVSERYTFKMRGPSFSDMREQNCFTDAVITSESGFEWNVHKVVMSRLGIFVYNSFKYPSFNGTLNMSVSDEVVQCIIDLAYKGECDIHHENVLETLEAAVMYQLESLIELCIDFILGNMITAEHVISVKTCMRVCQDGLKEMTDGALTEVVDKWIRKNFNDIFETEDIYELSPEELENYIKEDDLNIQEEDLLEFILKYATKNKLESEKTIQLLANVRLSLINSSRLSEIIETNQALTVEIEKSKDIQRITNYRLPRDIVIIFKKHQFWGYQNHWVFFFRYVGLAVVFVGILCLFAGVNQIISRILRRNHHIAHLQESQSSSHSQVKSSPPPDYSTAVSLGLPTYDAAVKLNPKFLKHQSFQSCVPAVNSDENAALSLQCHLPERAPSIQDQHHDLHDSWESFRGISPGGCSINVPTPSPPPYDLPSEHPTGFGRMAPTLDPGLSRITPTMDRLTPPLDRMTSRQDRMSPSVDRLILRPIQSSQVSVISGYQYNNVPSTMFRITECV